MTQTEAKKALAETWQFSRADGCIALREVALIEAVRAHEASRATRSSTSQDYVQAQLSPLSQQ